MKKLTKLLIILFTVTIFNSNPVYAAGSSDGGSGSNDKASLYKQGKKLVYRAKKLEKKNKGL